MSQYSFLDELIIAESLIIDLNSALHSSDSSRVENICRQLKNSANRILRKVQKYDDFYELSEIVACNVKRQNFLTFDNVNTDENT